MPHRQPLSLVRHLLLGALLAGTAAAADRVDDASQGWPRWRGPFGNGAAEDPGVPLVEDVRRARLVWTSEQEIPPPHDEGMKQIWTGGYASPVVAEGKVFLFYFLPHGRNSPRFTEQDVALFGERAKSQGKMPEDAPWWAWHVDDIVQAWDARTGELLWTYRDPRGLTPFAGKSGGHHAPCYADGRVFVLGTSGRLYCLDAATGEKVWEASPTESHHDAFERSQAAGKSVFEGRGFNQMPCAVDGVVAIARERDRIVGFHTGDGRRLWEVEVSGGYSVGGRGNAVIPVVWSHDGKNYLIAANSCIEPRSGEVLWAIPDALTSTAPCVTEDYYVCSGLDTGGGKDGRLGSTCFRISPRGYEKIWSLPRGRWPTMGCADAIAGGHFLQEACNGGEDSDSRSLWMVELATGEVVGKVPAFRDVGYSPITCRGVLYGGMYASTSIRLDPQRLEVFGGMLTGGGDRSNWGNSTSAALAYGHLYHRTGHRLVCYDLRAR